MKKSLTKAEILRNRRDIGRMFRNTAVFRTNGLHLRVRPTDDVGRTRALFATTRGFRTAVDRNRSRRLVREAFRLIKAEIRSPHDLAFVMYPGTFPAHIRAAQVRRLLERAGLVDRQ